MCAWQSSGTNNSEMVDSLSGKIIEFNLTYNY